jgi:SnoaL-like domain
VDPQPDPAVSLGREIVASVERRDWARLAACLSGDVVFRAVIDDQAKPFREHIGPDAVAAQIARWFDDGDIHELVESSVDVVADRLHVRYRIRNREVGQWYLVEQHLFATLSGVRVSSLDLLCSGFRSIPSPA